MSPATLTRPPPPARGATAPRPGRDVALGVLPLVAVSASSCLLLALPASHLVLTLALYAALGALLLAKLPRTGPGPGVGPANRVTLARSTLVLPLVALALRPETIGAGGYWWIVALATVALVLDSVDGPVARRTRTESALGARFDMEVDALLILALSALVWQSGKTGPWVLLIGGLRYLFVLAGVAWPWLCAPLPPRMRRKVVCVVQGVSLTVCLGPIVAPAAALATAAAALLLLVYSFAVDTWWLARARSPAPPPALGPPAPTP